MRKLKISAILLNNACMISVTKINLLWLFFINLIQFLVTRDEELYIMLLMWVPLRIRNLQVIHKSAKFACHPKKKAFYKSEFSVKWNFSNFNSWSPIVLLTILWKYFENVKYFYYFFHKFSEHELTFIWWSCYFNKHYL